MEKLTTIDLIAESPEAHGVYETPETTARTVIAEVRSITMAEFYRAKSAGITPELVFVLADYTEYGGEKLIQFEGEAFHVVRTYIAGQTIEIYAEGVPCTVTPISSGSTSSPSARRSRRRSGEKTP